MLENILPRSELVGIARAKGRAVLNKSVNNKLVDDALSEGWVLKKKGKATSSLSKPKSRPILFEDRVWTILYKMGLPFLSGPGGGNLLLNETETSKANNQLDVVAIDEELALVIECKTSEKFSKRPKFQEELAKLSQFRERFIRAINSGDDWKSDTKRTPVFLFFLENIDLSENDRERARDAKVLLFDEADLEYYEKLIHHIGPAARYQFYADAVPGRAIGGLTIRVPAVKTKMGGHNCYTFPISPDYLLKIAYVSHRAKGKASDIHAYQRMMSKARLNKIKEYISEQGIFPTNIVLNIEKKFLTFQRVKQENTEAEQQSSGTLGWLEIKPAYKSAWVIDGQHQLFAYSGHPRAASTHLSVLTFEGLSPSMQASLFVDINAKQKSVKQSLLQELYAELHWDAESPSIRVRAIVSKAIQVLDEDKGSPLYGRVLTADAQKDPIRCISLTSLYKAIAKPGLFVVKEVKGTALEYGPLWGGDNQKTLRRSVRVVKNWFEPISVRAATWWSLGSGEGGGLTMNDGITSCLNVMHSVLDHLAGGKTSLVLRDDDDLCELMSPYADAVADYLSSLTVDQRKSFRDLRGVQGQNYRTRTIQRALAAKYQTFKPSGLDEFFKRESEQTNIKAKVAIDHIEKSVQSLVIQELRQNFSESEDSWWLDGVPKAVRVIVANRVEQDDNKRGHREAYFDLIDYRKIVIDNWSMFQTILGYGKKNDSKDRQTKWIVDVNEMRNVVAHASSGRFVSIEDLAKLLEYEKWLGGLLSGTEPDIELEEADSEV